VTLVSPARPSAEARCTSSAAEVEALVRSHLPLVHHLVREVLSRVPSHVDRDDLVSAGMFALTVSAQSYQPGRGVPFAAFAAIRVRGALTDELRSMDWASRAVRSRARDIETTRNDLSIRLGRTPEHSEVAAELGLSAAEVAQADDDVRRAGLLSMQALTPAGVAALPSTPDGPESLFLQQEQAEELRAAIATLPERLRIVIERYFFEHQKMAPIAAELGVTESRVSQLRSEALLRLRDAIGAPGARTGRLRKTA
jgi:RNA polymerase sigma factor for flagellar operon FliA